MNLYIVATPIGNLEDITLRAIRILKEVDFVLSEDTRVTKKLLNNFEIKTPTISFHEHSKDFVYENILNLLGEGKNLALVTDAGTPAISDPGAHLINFLREKNKDIKIIPIPGPSSLVTALSVSGLVDTNFSFVGFLPKKKGRQTFFKDLNRKVKDDGAVVFFESGHRIIKTIEAVGEYFPEAKIVLAKELTKIHESIVFGNSQEILVFLNEKDRTKGEFVVVVH